MRSRELPLERYDTDKVRNGLVYVYDTLFAHWVDQPVVLLEIGVYRGGSLLLWRDYFPHGTVVGIDLQLPKDFPPTERILLFQGDQTDTAFLSRVTRQVAPQGFDIIIDDASHIGEYTKRTFWHLFDHHLKPGGLYVIEDWGTGYWDDWPDGKSLDLRLYAPPETLPDPPRSPYDPHWKRPWPNHSYGMVGFIKQLIDEQGAIDVTRKSLKGHPEREPKFESMFITTGLVCVRKARR
ncbi:MAG: class I SAM-dependent methyltransferase [Acidobacteriota bacterium]|nr:class I SAM-dependent methyltransferase [Acidobacteriota bacterium]